MYLFCPCYEFMIMVLVYPQTSRSLDFTSWSIGFSFFLLEFLVCALKKHLRSICTWFGAWLLPYSTPPSLTLHPLDKRVWVMDVDFQRPVEFKSVNVPSCHYIVQNKERPDHYYEKNLRRRNLLEKIWHILSILFNTLFDPYVWRNDRYRICCTAKRNASAYPTELITTKPFFQQAPARKVNISIFKHQIIRKLLARETYSKHHFAHLVLSEHLHAE